MSAKVSKDSNLPAVPQTEAAFALLLQRIAAFPKLPDEALVDPNTVAALFACSVETIKRRVRAGRFKPPLVLNQNTHRWRAGDIRSELARLASADQDQGRVRDAEPGDPHG